MEWNGCGWVAGFDLKAWLVNVSPKLIPVESILRDNGFDDKETLAMLNAEECEFLELKQALFATLEYESMYIPEALVFLLCLLGLSGRAHVLDDSAHLFDI